MSVLVWIVLPYLAFGSFVVGHIWRYRHDKFGWQASLKWEDPTRKLGLLMFRGGMLVLVLSWGAEFVMWRYGSEAAAITTAARAVSAGVGTVATVIGVAGVVTLQALRIASPVWPARNPVDKMMLPVLAATLFTGLALMFDTNESVPDSMVFAWMRSLLESAPVPGFLTHAPAMVQLRAELIMLLVAIWPYTRLVSVFAAPIGYLLRLPGRLPVARAPKAM